MMGAKAFVVAAAAAAAAAVVVAVVFVAVGVAFGSRKRLADAVGVSDGAEEVDEVGHAVGWLVVLGQRLHSQLQAGAAPLC